jgi:LCP family protein required for cell wall assembly
VSGTKRHIKSHYKRPRSHYFVLALNIVVVCALLVAGAGMLWANNRLNARQVVSLNRDPNGQPSIDAEITPSDSWNLTEGDLAAKNFLLTGSDNGSCVDPDSPYAGAFGDRAGFGERSDTIMIIRVDPKDNRAAFLSFPRDLWVKIAGSTRTNRINTAFDRKNPNKLVDTIYQNFGISVDHYVNIDFCAFKEIVNAVGGVSIPFLYETRDKKTGLYVPAPSCFEFSGDHALAYVRSRSGYSYFDPAKNDWIKDGTGDLGRISRQQDFIRRAMQRALDKGSSSPTVANKLLNAALKNVITDDQLTPISMLQLAQAMRDLNTSSIPTYTIAATGEMVGDQAVLVPRIQNDTMREILALFQGKASFATPGSATDAPPTSDMTINEGALGGITNVEIVPVNYVNYTSNASSSAPTTTLPVVAPEQATLGVAPPNDPSCR